jgi:histidinol-phosphate aminotransferase
MSALTASPGVAGIESYAPARHGAPTDLDLAGSAIGSARYPDASTVAALLAERFGVDASRVLVTAGADDALDRACRAVLAPGRSAILTRPTFEMLPRYVSLAGARLSEVAWPGGAFPVEAVIAAADANTSLIAIVSPNNPTGAVASFEEVRRVHDAVPSALILLDLAYAEFAECDITALALTLPRVVVVRTFSKAWQMPGIRVGYAMGSAEVIGWIRRAGSPYPVASRSLAAAEWAMLGGSEARDAVIAAVRRNRVRLAEALGAGALPSEANFVTVEGARARWVYDALAGLGIATRWLPADGGRTRITVPSDEVTFARLERAVRTALEPEALVFDMDGVLADVSQSYREAIVGTAARFGVTVSASDVRARKLAGGANDDWALTAGLIASGGVRATITEVTQEFERVYQGSNGDAGLKTRERLLVSPDWLAAKARRMPLAIATGRPRADAEEFLERFGIRGAFRVVVAREDGPIKPDAFPLSEALRRLGVERAWMIGDTPDDVTSARAAGVLPIGVLAPGETRDASGTALERAGAARVLNQTQEIDECLP